jgi:DNA-binding MarR family transcriptional regulator
MNVKELADTLYKLKTEHDLDSLDVILLASIGEDARVMPTIRRFRLTSQATAHARLKKLIKNKFVSIEASTTNLREKNIVLTEKLEEILLCLRTANRPN